MPPGPAWSWSPHIFWIAQTASLLSETSLRWGFRDVCYLSFFGCLFSIFVLFFYLFTLLYASSSLLLHFGGSDRLFVVESLFGGVLSFSWPSWSAHVDVLGESIWLSRTRSWLALRCTLWIPRTISCLSLTCSRLEFPSTSNLLAFEDLFASGLLTSRLCRFVFWLCGHAWWSKAKIHRAAVFPFATAFVTVCLSWTLPQVVKVLLASNMAVWLQVSSHSAAKTKTSPATSNAFFAYPVFTHSACRPGGSSGGSTAGSACPGTASERLPAPSAKQASCYSFVFACVGVFTIELAVLWICVSLFC